MSKHQSWLYQNGSAMPPREHFKQLGNFDVDSANKLIEKLLREGFGKRRSDIAKDRWNQKLWILI